MQRGTGKCEICHFVSGVSSPLEDAQKNVEFC